MLDTGSYMGGMEQAHSHGTPAIFNTDHRVQFSSGSSRLGC